MSLPTLLIRGNLRDLNNDPVSQRALDDIIPIDYIINWFQSRLGKTGMENKVLVLKSETASGKSSVFPPTLYNRLVRGKDSPGIICTQPRTATAIENVRELLKFEKNNMRLGENVGWLTRANKLRPKNVGLLSATIGTLERQLRTLTDDEIMAKYRYILIDETHERNLETDMTIYMLRNLLIRNKNKPQCSFVVFMSATFDPCIFLNYFGVRNSNFIWCTGHSFNKEEIWDWNQERTINDYTRAVSTIVETIVTNSGKDDISLRADILIFLPGKAEFLSAKSWLDKLNNKLVADGNEKSILSILQIDGPAFQTQNRDYQLTINIPVADHEVIIKDKKYTPWRRVILSTNVAETGLTLENLKYVIDSGFNREIEFNPILGIRSLITKPAPRSRIKQRIGRTGRKFDGVFYPLYPKYIYDILPLQQFPQILIEDIGLIFLEIIAEQLKMKSQMGDHDPEFKISDIEMLDNPTPDSLSMCLEKMYTIGFISPMSPKWSMNLDDILGAKPENRKKYGLTRLGILASRFNMISPECVRIILSAYYWDSSVLDMITIAAWLSLDARNIVFSEKKGAKVNINWRGVYAAGLPGFISKMNFYKIRLIIADEFIHGILLFNAIKYLIKSTEVKNSIFALQNWCEKNNISYRGCLDFIRLRDEFIEQMLIIGLDVFSQEENSISNSNDENFMDIITRIKYCIYDGFRNNLITFQDGIYKTIMGVKVVTPKLFREDEVTLLEKTNYSFVTKVVPKYMVYKELNLKYNKTTQIYDVLVDKVSVLSGYVSIDPDISN